MLRCTILLKNVTMEIIHSFCLVCSKLFGSLLWVCRLFSVGLAEMVTLYFYLQGGEVKGISYQSRFEVLLSLGFFLASTRRHAALCQTELLFSLNNLNDEFFLFLLLSFLSLALYSSVTNAYPLGGFSLHHLTTLSVFESRRGIRENHRLTPALTCIQMKHLTDEML